MTRDILGRRRLVAFIWLLLLVVTVTGISKDEQSCSADGVCTTTNNVSSSDHDNNKKKENDDDKGDCQDQHELCEFWASVDECDKNPNYMKLYCPKSCKTCHQQQELSSNGQMVAKTTIQTDNNKNFELGTDFGVAQTVYAATTDGSATNTRELHEKIQASRDYLASISKTMNKELLDMCENKHESCTYWASLGECQVNPYYMKKDCAPACHSCEFLSMEGRCPLDPDAPNAWKPGDLDAMFTRLTQEPYLSNYEVKIWSSPPEGPWVLTMENVVTEIEAKRLIDLGATEGYQISQNVGKVLPNGETERVNSTSRTSMNAWCENDCYKDDHALEVVYRLSNITGINETNSEYLQLLRYEVGQFYRSHHDYIAIHKQRQAGPRIMTFYLYLNDVEAGGGTKFDKLDLTITPKRGRAVLWPSVLNDNPEEKDDRTNHQALPVEAGLKYGANAWFHLRDYKTPHKIHCM